MSTEGDTSSVHGEPAVTEGAAIEGGETTTASENTYELPAAVEGGHHPQEGGTTPPPPDSHEDDGATGRSRVERRVAFDPEVQIATVVFHKEKTQQEIDDEKDVFERLYTSTSSRTQSAPATVKNVTAVPPSGAEGESASDAQQQGATTGEGQAATESTTPAVQPSIQKQRHVLPPPTHDVRLKTELVECSFKPKITSIAQEHRKTQSWEHFVQLQSEWSSQQVRKRTDNVKKQNVADGVGQLFDEIKRGHSKRIIHYLEKQHLYKSPQQAYRDGKKSALRSFMHHHDDSGQGGSSSYHRDPIVTDGAIFNRLYEEATVRDATIRVMEQTLIEKEARELFRPTTNESYWRPSTMLGARTPSRSLREAFSGGDANEYGNYEDNDVSSDGNYFGGAEAPIEEELLAKGEEYRRRREARQNASELQQEVHTFKPVMNPTSRRILLRRALEQEMERDEDMWYNGEEDRHESVERGETTAAGHASQSRRTRTSSFHESEDLFLERRKDAAEPPKPKAAFDAEVFTARMQRRDVDRAQKLAALRRSLKLEEISECTFRPSITQKSNLSAQRQRGTLSFSPQVKQTPKSFVQQPVESFSPEEIVRAQAGGRRQDNGPATRKAVAAPEAAGRQQQRVIASSGGHHDGDAYLQNLEDELKGVIAEWTTISATTAS